MANISKIKLEYYQISSGEDLVAKLGITIIFLKLESVEKEKESLYSIRNEFRIRREQLFYFKIDCFAVTHYFKIDGRTVTNIFHSACFGRKIPDSYTFL